MADIMPICREETTRLDFDKIEELETALGQSRCRKVMADVCLDLIGKSSRLEAHMAAGETQKVAAIAKALSGLSQQIGLQEYSVAARNLHDCAEQDDKVALAAVWARLERLGENSLFVVLELANVSEV